MSESPDLLSPPGGAILVAVLNGAKEPRAIFANRAARLKAYCSRSNAASEPGPGRRWPKTLQRLVAKVNEPERDIRLIPT